MNTNLTIQQNETPEQWLAKLNQATGFNSMPFFPHLKFNAEDGKWLKETAEKDEKNKPIYKPMGKRIEMHIITTRKMVQSNFDAKEQLYSREFQDNYVELYNQNKQIVLKGLYSALKLSNPDLKYFQVLYVFVEGKPYRIKLGGVKLTTLFPYLNSFKNDNPAKYITIAETGNKVEKSRAVSYYELNFTKGEQILDIPLIVKRVNDINDYLSAYNSLKKSEVMPEIISNEEPPIPDNFLDEPVLTPEQEAEVR